MEIAKSVQGPKLQVPYAEDEMAKPYLAENFCEEIQDRIGVVQLGDLSEDNGI